MGILKKRKKKVFIKWNRHNIACFTITHTHSMTKVHGRGLLLIYCLHEILNIYSLLLFFFLDQVLQELELVLQSCLPLELVTLTMTTTLMTLKTLLNHNLNIYHISLFSCLYYYLTVIIALTALLIKNKHFLCFSIIFFYGRVVCNIILLTSFRTEYIFFIQEHDL